MLLLLLFVPSLTSANSPAPGPEREFTLHLVNAPKETYCVTILTREPGATQSDLLRDVPPDQRKMVVALFSLKAEGWYPVSEVSNSGLIFQDGGSFRFGWQTVTQSLKEYRIILVTVSGTVHVSNSIARRDYANEARYDLRSNQLTQSIDYWEYVKRVMIAVGVTLFVELWLLKKFKFSNPRNRRIVIATNLFTQTLLNFILFVTHYYEFSKADITWLLILEAVIPIIEGFVYAKLFAEGTVKQRVTYAIVANLSSFAAGMLIYNIGAVIFVTFWGLFWVLNGVISIFTPIL